MLIQFDVQSGINLDYAYDTMYAEGSDKIFSAASFIHDNDSFDKIIFVM